MNVFPRLFHKVCREEYGTQNGPTMLAVLENQVSYNKKCKESCALIRTSSQGASLVALCSPLVKKVYQLKYSGEVCFIDSSGNIGRENCSVSPPDPQLC